MVNQLRFSKQLKVKPDLVIPHPLFTEVLIPVEMIRIRELYFKTQQKLSSVIFFFKSISCKTEILEIKVTG